MIASGLHRFVLRQTMVSFHIINFLIKDHLSRGAGNAIPMKVSSGQGPPSFQKTFPEAGIVIPTKVLRLRPTFLLKNDHRFITFYKWPGSYPDEGFVAKAHLPYE
jgi:hypothetical protein